MSGQFSPRVRELATSLVGAAATAAGAALVPWLGDLLPGLEQCLSATHTPDTQALESRVKGAEYCGHDCTCRRC